MLKLIRPTRIFSTIRPFLILCFLYGPIPLNSNAQRDQTDSLANLIVTREDNKEKVDRILELGRLFYNSNLPDSASARLTEAVTLAARLGYDEGLADAWYWLSVTNYRMTDYETAQKYLDNYLDMCFSLQDSSRLAKGYFQQGRIFKDLNQYNLALHYNKLSLAFYLGIGHPLGIYANYNVLGSIYSNISEYDSAAVYYLKAIDICKSEGNELNLATLYSNITEVFLQMEQYEDALEYTNMALEINNRYPDNISGFASIYMDLGRIAAEQERYTDALKYYDYAIRFYQEADDQIGVLNVYNNYGDLFFRQKKYEMAIRYFNMALEGYKESGYLHGMVTALGNKAAALEESGNYEESMILKDSCLRISFREGNKELRKDIYWNIANASEKQGDYKKAYQHLELYTELKDSIFKLDKVKLINELDIIHKKAEILAANEALENLNLRKDLELQKKTRQRDGFLYSGAGLLVIGLFLLVHFRQKAIKDKIIASQKIRQLEEEKKLMAAKLLIEGQEEERKRIARELHDGLGVLLSATKMQFTSIKDLSPENQPLLERASQLLEQATGDVRKISHNMMPGLLTKLGLFEAVEELFDNLNDAENMNALCEITGEHDERLPENKEIMLYRIVQELVNNTLKHAQAGNISIKIKVFPDHVHINYHDDGKGFDVDETMKSEAGAFGLKSLQSRVGFLSGTMAIDSKAGEGTSYTIQVPV
jgi:signal transduction histidine kinase